MLQGVWEHFQAFFGLGDYAAHAGAVQIALRTVLVHVSTLAIVRLGSKRFLSKATAFDVIVAIMLGSIMSRAVDAASPFFPTLLVAGTMLALHWLLGVLAYRVGWFGSLVKGTRTLLIKDGQIQWKGMRQRSITHNDLTQALRTQTKQTDPRKIQLAYQERDGDISVVPYKQEPRILDVSVRDGVQTVRIELQ